MQQQRSFINILFLLSLAISSRAIELKSYNITTFPNIVVPEYGESVWSQYDLEFDSDFTFDFDPINFPYFDDQNSPLCTNWDATTSYDPSGISETPTDFSPEKIPGSATVITEDQIFFNIRISNPDTCGTVLISVIPITGYVKSVVLRDVDKNSLRTSLQSNGENFDGYTTNSDAGIAVECCHRIRKIFQNKGKSWNGDLLLEVNLAIPDGIYSVQANSSPKNLPISVFYPIVPFDFLYPSNFSKLEFRNSYCPPFHSPPSTIPKYATTFTCFRLRPKNSQNSLSDYFTHLATVLNPKYTIEQPSNRKISIGIVKEIPAMNFSLEYDLSRSLFKFPSTGLLLEYPTEADYTPQCNLTSLQKVNDTFYDYINKLSAIKNNPYQNYVYWIASLMTSVDYFSCYQLGISALGNSEIGHVMSTYCPADSDSVVGDIGTDPCCNTSMSQCCAPRNILAQTYPALSSSVIQNVCTKFSQFPENAEITSTCSFYSLNLFRTNVLPNIHKGIVRDSCQFYAINVSSANANSKYPIFDQCADKYFQINCFSNSYRCARISPDSVCLTGGYCTIPCKTDSDCRGGVQCGVVEGFRTCLVPPLSAFTKIEEFSNCIYDKLTYYEQAFLSILYFPNATQAFADDITSPQCTGGRIDRTIDFGVNLEFDYPGVYSQKNWNSSSCESDFTCNWVYNYPKGANTQPYISEAECLNTTHPDFCGICFSGGNEYCNEKSVFTPFCTIQVDTSTIYDCTQFGSSNFNQFSTGTCVLDISDQDTCLRSNNCRKSSSEECDNSYCASLVTPCTATLSNPLPYNTSFTTCWEPNITSQRGCTGQTRKWISDVRRWHPPYLSTKSECESTGQCVNLPPQVPSASLSTLTDKSSCEKYTVCTIFNQKYYIGVDLADKYLWENISRSDCLQKGWCRGRNLFECIHPTAKPEFTSDGKFTCPTNFIPTLEFQNCNLDYDVIYSAFKIGPLRKSYASWASRNPGMEFLPLWPNTMIDYYSSLCNSYGFNVTWFYDTFPTQASCENAKACVKTSVNGSVEIIPKKNEFDCISCNNNTFSDFYNWTSPYLWLPASHSFGQWLAYKWTPRAITRPYKWVNMIDKNRYDKILQNISDTLERLKMSALLTCRFAPRLEALQKFTCGCSGNTDCIPEQFRKCTKSTFYVQPICTHNPTVTLSGFGSVDASTVKLNTWRLLKISKIKWDQFGWSVSLSGVDFVPRIQKNSLSPGFFSSDNVVYGNVIGDGYEIALNEPLQQNITLEIIFEDLAPNFPRKFYVTSGIIYDVPFTSTAEYDGFSNLTLDSVNRIYPEDFPENPKIKFVLPAGSQVLVLFPVVLSEEAQSEKYIVTFEIDGQVVIFVGLAFYVVMLGIFIWQYIMHSEKTGSFLSDWSLPKVAILFMMLVSLVKVVFFCLLLTGIFQAVPALGLCLEQLSALLFFNICTIVVIRWAEIYHYTMEQQKNSGVLRQLFPAAVGITVVLYAFWIATVIAFFVVPTTNYTLDCFTSIVPHPTSAQLTIATIYRAGFIVFCLILSVAFIFYSYQVLQLINESLKMRKNRTGNASDDSTAKLRLMLVSIGTILSFLAQASYLIVIVATETQESYFQSWKLALFLILEAIPSFGFLIMFNSGGIFGKPSSATSKTGKSAKSRGPTSVTSKAGNSATVISVGSRDVGDDEIGSGNSHDTKYTKFPATSDK